MLRRHQLNDRGRHMDEQVRKVMQRTLNDLEALYPSGSREASLVRTKLQEAHCFAALAVALDDDNIDRG